MPAGSCEVGLGRSILTKAGIWQLRGLNETIDAFIDALETQLSSFFKAGAIASARELPCTGDDGDTAIEERFADQQLAALSFVPREAFGALPHPAAGEEPHTRRAGLGAARLQAGFTEPVRHRLALGISTLGEPLYTPSPALYIAADDPDPEKRCCAFHGKVTSYGDVSFKLTIQGSYGPVTVTVAVDLGYTTAIAGTVHRGFCNPPKLCTEESIIATVLVTYTGKLKVEVTAEIDLGALGKVKPGRANALDLAVGGVDRVACTIRCRDGEPQ